MSPSEKQALLHITKRDDIIIKPADKGGAVVVSSWPLHDAEAHRQLYDGTFYERLNHDPIKEYPQVLKTAVKQIIQANALPASAKNLISQTPRTSRFYLLPKIHKENNPGRPIVSACNCPTENIASYLDMVMSPLVCDFETLSRTLTMHYRSLELFSLPTMTPANASSIQWTVKSGSTVHRYSTSATQMIHRRCGGNCVF